MPMLPTESGRIGRGFGLGWNRARTRRNQLHGGQDFIAPEGTAVRAPLSGIVELVSSDTGPRVNVAQAKTGRTGKVQGFKGYGNVVVLRHDNMSLPGLPSTFWTSYNHLSQPLVAAGQYVSEGMQLGLSGSTNNGQFRGMGAHLHVEVRRRPYPGSYDRDTVDPEILWRGLGIRTTQGAGLSALHEYEPPPEEYEGGIDTSTEEPIAYDDTPGPDTTPTMTTTSTPRTTAPGTSNAKPSFPMWPVIGGAAILLFALVGGTRD